MHMPPVNLTAHTVTLLRNRPSTVTLDDVAVGACVGRSWLSALLNGQIKTPSADKIQSLYEFLSKKPLIPVTEN